MALGSEELIKKSIVPSNETRSEKENATDDKEGEEKEPKEGFAEDRKRIHGFIISEFCAAL